MKRTDSSAPPGAWTRVGSPRRLLRRGPTRRWETHLTPPPYDYVVEDDRRVLYVRAHRTLTATDVYALLDRQIRDAVWTYGLLYDLRMTNGPTASADSVAIAARVAELVKAHGPRGPVALVTKDVAMCAVPEMHARHACQVVMRVFTNFSDAKQWLTHQSRTPSTME